MTDKEILTMADQYGLWIGGHDITFTDIGLVEFIRAVIKAEREKLHTVLLEAHEQAKETHNYYLVAANKLLEEGRPVKTYCGGKPNYVEREWIGLTEDEICEAAEIDGADAWLFEIARNLEAKLKEKNTWNHLI